MYFASEYERRDGFRREKKLFCGKGRNIASRCSLLKLKLRISTGKSILRQSISLSSKLGNATRLQPASHERHRLAAYTTVTKSCMYTVRYVCVIALLPSLSYVQRCNCVRIFVSTQSCTVVLNIPLFEEELSLPFVTEGVGEYAGMKGDGALFERRHVWCHRLWHRGIYVWKREPRDSEVETVARSYSNLQNGY